MVNFNDGQTISTPSLNINKIMILQRRAEFIDAYERWFEQAHQENENNLYLSRMVSKLNTLFLEIRSMLKRKLKQKNKLEEYNQLKIAINSNDSKKIISAFEYIDDFLDQIQITPVDIKRQIDTSRIEEINKYKGL